MKGKWKEKGYFEFPFFRSVTPRSKNVLLLEVYAWLGGSVKVATFFCHQVGQIWSYRAVIFFPCSKSRDLGPGHGFRACSFKIERKKVGFSYFGGQKNQTKIEQKWRNRSNVGLRSSRWYQKDAEGRRGYFRKIRAWETLKKQGQMKMFLGIFPIFPVDLT